MLMDHFRKTRKENKKFKESGNSKYIYQNELDRVCFQHDMTYGDFKDLPRRTASDKVLHDEAIDIAKRLKCDGYQRGLPSMVYKFFETKSAGANTSGGVSMLKRQLDKYIIKNF